MRADEGGATRMRRPSLRGGLIVLAVMGIIFFEASTAVFAENAVRPHAAANLLYNGDIEAGCRRDYRKYQEWDVAEGWSPWYIRGAPQDEAQGYFKRPEFQCMDASLDELYAIRVHDGRWSQKIFNSFATHVAGMWQQVAVPIGARVTFTAWGQTWSSDGDDPLLIEGDGNYWLKIGIDPTGAIGAGADGEVPGKDVVWSEAKQANLEWVELSVTAEAQTNLITVFTWGAPVYRVAANNSYWDDLSLTVGGGVGSAGLRATAESTPWVIAAVAATPRPERIAAASRSDETSATTKQSAGEEHIVAGPKGRVCVEAFADYNGDGLPGLHDVALADFAFSIDGITHVTGGEKCLWVSPGVHLVESEESAVLSTADVWDVQLQPNGMVFVAFGVKAGAVGRVTTLPLWLWILIVVLLGILALVYAMQRRDSF